ncbi:hypothetical protein [Janthinobacterium sp. RB2R34]|uniref:hypothetical protein n=1 Tax=Janthinobacterium sp. RB2R34 TaxID=3424193 RepID=UPI003F520579
MQKMLTTTTLSFRLVLTLALAVPMAVSAAPQTAVQRQEAIYTRQGDGPHGQRADALPDATSFDKGSRRLLMASEKTLAVFSLAGETATYFVVVASIPSRKPQSASYCGAGYQDHLLLLAYDGRKTTLRDDFLLQSCLRSITLESEGTDDILQALAIDADHHTIRFRWLSDREDTHHTLTIANGKFLLR